eukprot:3106170-Rhodomonas_salina.2
METHFSVVGISKAVRLFLVGSRKDPLWSLLQPSKPTGVTDTKNTINSLFPTSHSQKNPTSCPIPRTRRAMPSADSSSPFRSTLRFLTNKLSGMFGIKTCEKLDSNLKKNIDLRKKARAEIEELRQDRGPKARPCNIDVGAGRESKPDRVSQDEAELMQLVKAAERSGNVRITRNSARSPRRAQKMRDTQALISMVKTAQRDGHIRILRRPSTESVTVPGFGPMRVAGPKHSKSVCGRMSSD